MKRTCAFWCCLALFLGCAATCGVLRLTDPTNMEIDEAMALAGRNLTDKQRALVIAAVRRQMLAGVRLLLETEGDDTDAGREARVALTQLRNEIIR